MGCNDQWTKKETIAHLEQRCNLLMKCLCDTIRRNDGLALSEETIAVYEPHRQAELAAEESLARRNWVHRRTQQIVAETFKEAGNLYPDPSSYQTIYGLAENTASREYDDDKARRDSDVLRRQNAAQDQAADPA